MLDSLGWSHERIAALLGVLKGRAETVATAESLTAGLLCAALTDVAGASAVVRGGLIVYATELKALLAGVDSTLLAERGAVHPKVAEELAAGARRRCGASWGIGLTGVAGPDPQDGISPGTIHLGISGPTGLTVHSVRVDGDRYAVRAAAVRVALEQFERVVR
jgi:nicotinamide-nucleotide amidase